MLQCKLVVDSPEFDETADEHRTIEADGQGDPEEGESHQREVESLGQRQLLVPGGLTRNGDVGTASHPVTLDDEGGQGDGEEHQAKTGCQGLIVTAHDGQIDGGGQNVEISPQQDGVAEIRQGFDDRQQKGVGDAGTNQRPDDGAEAAPAGGSQGVARLFQGGIQGLDHPREDEVGHGGEGEGLSHDNAGVAEDEVYPEAQDSRCKPAHLAEHEDNCQTDDEGGGDDGQQGEGLHDFPQGEPGPFHHQGKGESQGGGEQPHRPRHEYAVFQDPHGGGVGPQGGDEVGRIEPSLHHHTSRQDDAEGKDYKKDQQNRDTQDGAGDEKISPNQSQSGEGASHHGQKSEKDQNASRSEPEFRGDEDRVDREQRHPEEIEPELDRRFLPFGQGEEG